MREWPGFTRALKLKANPGVGRERVGERCSCAVGTPCVARDRLLCRANISIHCFIFLWRFFLFRFLTFDFFWAFFFFFAGSFFFRYTGDSSLYKGGAWNGTRNYRNLNLTIDILTLFFLSLVNICSDTSQVFRRYTNICIIDHNLPQSTKMDQVKSQTAQAETKDQKPNMTSLESYQSYWEQLMENTEKELQKIRGSSLTPDPSYAGSY